MFRGDACYICQEPPSFWRPTAARCRCTLRSHDHCIRKWIAQNGRYRCEACRGPYVIPEPLLPAKKVARGVEIAFGVITLVSAHRMMKYLPRQPSNQKDNFLLAWGVAVLIMSSFGAFIGD